MHRSCSRRSGPRRCRVVPEVGYPGGDLPLRLRRERRQPSVRGIDHQRGPVVEVAVGQPELVVVAGGGVAGREVVRIAEGGDEDAVGERRVALAAGEELRVARLQPGQLLVGQRRLVAQDLRTLQRRGGVVGPHALQVRPAGRGARHGPLLFLRRLRLTGQRDHQQSLPRLLRRSRSVRLVTDSSPASPVRIPVTWNYMVRARRARPHRRMRCRPTRYARPSRAARVRVGLRMPAEWGYPAVEQAYAFIVRLI